MTADGTAQPNGAAGRRTPRYGMPRRALLLLLRACGADGNPLCRRNDRRRARLLLAAAALLLLAPLAALLTGQAVHRHGRDAAAARSAQQHRVTAVTLAAAVPGQVRAGQRPDVLVEARWAYPPGHVRTGRLAVAPGTAAGARVPLRVDAAGRPVRPPRSAADIDADAWFAGVGTFAVLAALTVTGTGLVRRALDRHEARAWARRWAEVEPEWSGRRPHGIDGR
ncbi:hypothetical protein [Streptomyces sp. NPDC001380]|uniref:Rv1733c family protein n=1 Tax=Streptomyces sp. NPDC001380 TaxID=3364566 RepID=UPI0036BEC8B9